MSLSNGTLLNQLIGVGLREDPETKKLVKVTDFYRNYHWEVLVTFRKYPVFKYFGITVEDAMRLPVDRWNDIVKACEGLEHENGDETIRLMKDMMEVIKATFAGGA